MSILVVNAGSTSVKYKLFASDCSEQVSGMIEARENGCVSRVDRGGRGTTREIPGNGIHDHAGLILEETGGFSVQRIGFRVVHGGEQFTRPTRLTDDVVARLDALGRLAPLHNPPAVASIREFRGLLPGTPQYAVFDTAFHSTLAPQAFLYAIPYELYEQHRIRKYGFHGISHQYVSGRLAELEAGARRQVVCHLGGGASIAAVDGGRCVETSMGFTPLAGLTMATRSGDLDVGVVFHLMDELGFSLQEVRDMLNRKSGLLGLSGRTSDMRTLLECERDGDRQAALAIGVYIHHVQRYVGAYAAVLGGLDALAFTAGVGSASAAVRERVCATLDYLGIEIDEAANRTASGAAGEVRISAPGSLPVWVIPTNEELQICRQIETLDC